MDDDFTQKIYNKLENGQGRFVCIWSGNKLSPNRGKAKRAASGWAFLKHSYISIHEEYTSRFQVSVHVMTIPGANIGGGWRN